ncbi:hypothetical protein GQ53DRAFT_755952 [Thozetella sp. PMI_491]|nr:hypothetical protein GQ53DRAFT_755952 [Thozetella sp. PMI_491]
MLSASFHFDLVRAPKCPIDRDTSPGERTKHFVTMRLVSSGAAREALALQHRATAGTSRRRRPHWTPLAVSLVPDKSKGFALQGQICLGGSRHLCFPSGCSQPGSLPATQSCTQPTVSRSYACG